MRRRASPFRSGSAAASTAACCWDARAGGILIDGGYIQARPVLVGSAPDDGEAVPIKNRWRVTTRKVLRFSDRTPYASAPGLLDFGQLLNYLASGGGDMVVETDFYGSESMGKSRSSAKTKAGERGRDG